MHEQYACVTCNCQSLDPISLRTNTSELWPIYKAKYNKTYNPFEDKKYFEIFKENVKKIAEHNQKFESGQCAEGDDWEDADNYGEKRDNGEWIMNKPENDAKKPEDAAKKSHVGIHKLNFENENLKFYCSNCKSSWKHKKCLEFFFCKIIVIR